MEQPLKAKGFTLSGHRRVGLVSLICAACGGAWVFLVVSPGLPKTDTKKSSVVVGAFGIPLWGTKQEALPSPSPIAAPASDGTTFPTEAVFVAAPTGLALQMLLMSARFNTAVSPAVAGDLSVSCAVESKPFWQVLGRVVGAAPTPGVQIARGYDGYRVLPRNLILRRGEPEPYFSPQPVPVVPLSDGQTTHRMAGYVSLAITQGTPPERCALLETRIPGQVPLYRVVRIGDALPRKDVQAIAEETEAAQNIDVAPVVQAIEADAVVLRGGGDKTLRVPLGASGVADTFSTMKIGDVPAGSSPTGKVEQR